MSSYQFEEHVRKIFICEAQVWNSNKLTTVKRIVEVKNEY